VYYLIIGINYFILELYIYKAGKIEKKYSHFGNFSEKLKTFSGHDRDSAKRPFSRSEKNYSAHL
jgi:hypothetical protein